MLTKTFCHIKGITEDFEQLLWNHGINHWDDFFSKINLLSTLPKTKLEKIKNELPLSQQALLNNNLSFFKTALKPKDHWRLSHLGKIAFVDIETTGLSKWSDDISIIGIYDGSVSHLYINGKNLPDAHAKLKEFDIVVTFNGKQFDIPFIEQHFSCTYDFIHLDLRYMFKEIGYQGGLKNIENQIGIQRDADLHGIDGFEAVRLWHAYKRGNQAALEKLLKYNEQDIVNLKTLLEFYMKRKHELLLA